MAEQTEPLAEEAQAPEADLGAPAETEGDRSLLWHVLDALWYYHPLIFLAFSLGFAALAYSVKPERVSFKPKPARELYAAGLASLRRVKDPDASLDPERLEAEIRSARTDFEILFLHRFREIADHPDFINPYLLMAEASRLYADHIPLERRERYEEASLSYRRAIEWEGLERFVSDEAAYVKGNFGTTDQGGVPPPAELAARRRRRLWYLRYHAAVTTIELQRFHRALAELQKLDQEFRQQELERQYAETAAGPAARGQQQPLRSGLRYLPAEFELVREDRVRLHYHLGRVHEGLGEQQKAQRAYRLFLLQAPRSQERFLALMRLGGMHMSRGRELLTATVRKEAGPAAVREAQHHFRLAADKYSQVVEAAAPEGVLREAYFRGGMAYLAMARGTEVGRRTWWDVFSAQATALRGVLKAFAGRELPERTQRVPGALGRLIVGGGVELPVPLGLVVDGATGGGFALAVAERSTQRARRDQLLDQARSFFAGAAGGEGERFTASARVMIARTLLAKRDLERARRLFRHTRETYPEPEIETACIWGEAKAYLLDGELDKAKTRLLGGMEKTEPSRLQEGEVSWVEFCRALAKHGPAAEAGPARRVWALLPADARETVRWVARTRRADEHRRGRLLLAMNRILRRQDLYAASAFASVVLPHEAVWLLNRDPASFDVQEREWLNRRLLHAAFPQMIAEGAKATQHRGLPGAAALPSGLLIEEDDVMSDLQRLARAYVSRADGLQEETRRVARERQATPESRILPSSVRTLYVRQRRALHAATQVNEFLLDRYHPNRSDLFMETAEIVERLAEVVADRPFVEEQNALRLVAKAARSYLEAVRAAPQAAREEEALWQAGRNFYHAGLYERAAETFTEYLEKYKTSDRAGIVQNLLGRAYRNLGQFRDAVRVYRDNADRRTPAGHKALFYLGWVYLQQEQDVDVDGTVQDRIGDPERPQPRRVRGILQIESALQAFNRIRELPGLSPESRPWRWATFGLGRTWFRIAERERARELAAREAGEQPRPDLWIEFYRDKAQAYLREALNRYRFRSTDGAGGLDPARQPEDYGEVVCARFVAEYYLARVQTVLREALGDPVWGARARRHFEHLIDAEVYPDAVFHTPDPDQLYLAIARAAEVQEEGGRTAGIRQLHPLLGVVEGPVYSPRLLRHLRRNAFFLLAQNYTQEGNRLEQEAPERAKDAFRSAYGVYQVAHDRLPPEDAPLIMYRQAECLRRLGQREEAERQYALARNTARTLRAAETAPLKFLGPDYWAELSAERLQDHEDGF